MGLRDKLASMMHGKGSDPLPPLPPPVDTPDFYAGIKQADEDLYVAAMHLKTLAEEVLSQSGRNPDAAAAMADYTAFGNQAATDWINSNYSLPPFLAEAYGKDWLTDNAREMFEAVCKASVVADRDVASALRTSIQLIAVAGSSMLVHGLFVMMQNPDSERATRNAAEATASAKTYILGL